MSWHAAETFDPWAPRSDDDMHDIQDHELDQMDCLDDESAPATPYIQSSTGWITQAKAHTFVHGCRSSPNEAQAQAYRALCAPNRVETFLGMDHSLGQCRVEDVRSQPVDQDEGYETMDPFGHVPNHAEIVRCLLQHQDLIDRSDMIYLIVDNRSPEEVPYWPAFARWWASRRRLVGPQREKTDILWVKADQQSGLRDVPYCWAGVFVLEAARFLYSRQHFGLVDNDCVPVTLLETPDLISLAVSVD